MCDLSEYGTSSEEWLRVEAALPDPKYQNVSELKRSSKEKYAICSRLAINAHVVVINVNYRHTPEYTYPTAWNDAKDAFLWVCDNATQLYGYGDRTVVGGISAGAWLAAYLTLAALKSELPVSSAPAIPRSGADDPLFGNSFSAIFSTWKPDPADKRLNPSHLSAEEANRMPRNTLRIVGYDPLRDEGLLYGKLLAENRVPTNVNMFKGVPHGIRRFGGKLSVCQQWDRVMEDRIQ